MPILYTAGQLREALGLPKETFRYWKKAFPVLAGSRDQRPRFAPSDLLATALVKRLTETFGIPVAKLAPVADQLFSLCRDHAWPQLERMAAVFHLDKNEVRFEPEDRTLTVAEVALVLPLRPVVDALRAQLHQAEFDAQSSFAFPPFALPKRGAK